MGNSKPPYVLSGISYFRDTENSGIFGILKGILLCNKHIYIKTAKSGRMISLNIYTLYCFSKILPMSEISKAFNEMSIFKLSC